jgi:hypothetical protein
MVVFCQRLKAEDGRALIGLVAPNPLEDAAPVVQRARGDVNGRALPTQTPPFIHTHFV